MAQALCTDQQFIAEWNRTGGYLKALKEHFGFGSIRAVSHRRLCIEKKLGITLEKAWSPTMDDRTRPDHAAMDPNDFIPLDAKFIVGGEEADRPGDPPLSAGNQINCRCVQIQREAE